MLLNFLDMGILYTKYLSFSIYHAISMISSGICPLCNFVFYVVYYVRNLKKILLASLWLSFWTIGGPEQKIAASRHSETLALELFEE